MGIEFYTDRISNYQVGDQCLNVDFGRLPASRQAELLQALMDPGSAANLAIITKARGDYAGAFQRVSAMGTLPAPSLEGSNIPFPAGAVDLILAYLFQHNFIALQELSSAASEMSNRGAHANMDLADKVKADRDKASHMEMIEKVAGGVAGVVAGSVGLGGAGYSAGAVTKHRRTIDDLHVTKKKLDTQQEQCERTANQLRDQAQANKDQVQELKRYVDEVNSKDGLSAASRKKIDDEIADKKAQMDQCDRDQAELRKAIDHKETAAKDASKSEAEKQALKEERFQLENNMKALKAKEERLKEDAKALEHVCGMQDTKKQVMEMQAEIDRLRNEMTTDKSLTESEKRAKQLKVERLEAEMKAQAPKLTKEHADHGVAIQDRSQQLEDEARRMQETAAAHVKASQDHIKDRQAEYAQKEAKLQDELNLIQGLNMTWGSITSALQSLGAFFAPVGQQGSQASAEADFKDKVANFNSEHSQAAKQFADKLSDLGQRVIETEKTIDDNNNEVSSSIARNI
jgi:chromosome segregation ATPase